MEISCLFFFATLQVLFLEVIYLFFVLGKKRLRSFGILGCALLGTYALALKLPAWWAAYRPAETTGVEWAYEEFILPNVEAAVLILAGFTAICFVCKLLARLLTYMGRKKKEEDDWTSNG